MAKAGALRVEIEASPVYELLLQLTVFSGFESLETFDAGADWRDRQGRKCSPQLLKALVRLGGPYANLDQLIGIQMTQPSPSIPAFLQRVNQMAAHEVKLHLAGFYSEAYPAHIETTILAAAAGNPKARLAASRALSGTMPERKPAIARLLATPAEEVKQLALEVVSEWYQRIFAAEEATTRTALAADARAKRALLGTEPERLVLIATGINFKHNRFTRSLLIPTLIMRPWVAVMHYKGVCIYAYPVTEDPTTAETARRGVARVFQALGDEQRLRILKLLASNELTLDELSRRLGQPPNLVRSHIAVLRAGRIVQINCADDRMTYQLRGDIMRTIGQPLQSYLKLAPSLT